MPRRAVSPTLSPRLLTAPLTPHAGMHGAQGPATLGHPAPVLSAAAGQTEGSGG